MNQIDSFNFKTLNSVEPNEPGYEPEPLQTPEPSSPNHTPENEPIEIPEIPHTDKQY